MHFRAYHTSSLDAIAPVYVVHRPARAPSHYREGPAMSWEDVRNVFAFVQTDVELDGIEVAVLHTLANLAKPPGLVMYTTIQKLGKCSRLGERTIRRTQ